MSIEAGVQPIAGKRQIPPPNFDALARLYRWMEYASFGPWLWRCRLAFLGDLAACRSAAILGDGDGRFTARLLAANQEIELDAVDASEAMLRSQARRAGAEAGRLRLHHADARQWDAGDQRFDAVASHFFLDCLTTDEVRELAKKMRGTVSDTAVWVISEFALPRGWLMRRASAVIVALLYRAFGLMTGLQPQTLPDYADALRDAEFTLEKKRTWLGGLLVSELWRVRNGKNA
jgi:trans-aconitate methyltransferase